MDGTYMFYYEAAPYNDYWQIRELDPRDRVSNPGRYRRVVARRRSGRQAQELVALIMAKGTQAERDAVIEAAQDANWPK